MTENIATVISDDVSTSNEETPKIATLDGQSFDVVRDDSSEEEAEQQVDQSSEALSVLKTESIGRGNDESNQNNERTMSPHLLNDDELKMFEHLAQLDYESNKKEKSNLHPSSNTTTHRESFENSNLDEEPLIQSQISVSNTVDSEDYTITTNYTITTTHPLSSININTSVSSESSSYGDLEHQENKIEVPVEVTLSPRELGKSIIPGLNALRGSTMLPNPPVEDHMCDDEEYDEFQEVSLGNDLTPQKGKRRHDANESFDCECNVWCFAQPLSYLFTQLFSNKDSNYKNEVEMNVNNKEIEV